MEKKITLIQLQMAKAENMRESDALYDEIIVDLSTKYTDIGAQLEEVSKKGHASM